MRTMLKSLAVGSLIAAPLLFLANPAQAFTNVSLANGTLNVTSTDAADNITISRSGGFVTVANANDGLIPSAPCTKFGNTAAATSWTEVLTATEQTAAVASTSARLRARRPACAEPEP